MSKLNKTQTANLVTATVKETIHAFNHLIFKGKEDMLCEALTKALHEVVGPKTGGGVSDKINEDGEVYCNYFDTYLPAEFFKTKTDSKYKANCIDAEKILRKLKTTKASVERGAISEMRAKNITPEECEAILAKLDIFVSKKYGNVSEVKWEEA